MSSVYRSSSSPNLTDAEKEDENNTDNLYDQYRTTDKSKKWRKYLEHNHKDYCDIDFDDEFFVVGDRVLVDQHRAGSVAYFGEVDYAAGDWVGVVLDEPTGNHDGKVHGYEYFQCAPFHGTFVRPHRVSRASALGGASSRTPTPLPTFQHFGSSRAKSPGASTIGSGYYYDDDYRQEQAPSVASLARKLKQLDEAGSGGRPLSGGILKPSNRLADDDHGQLSSGRSSLGSRADELSRRISRASSLSRGTVFNFRPKREQLAEEATSSSGYSGSPAGRRSVNLASEPPKRADRVLVDTERGQLRGILRFMGQTSFALGEWAGVELDNCEGKNDGSVLGQRYFYCPKNYGLFVPANRVRKCTGPMEFSERMRSTLTSPPPARSSSSFSESYSRASTPISPAIERDHTGSMGSPYSTGYSSGSGLLDDYKPLGTNTRLLNQSYKYSSPYGDSLTRPKFDERDLDAKLKQSLARSKSRTYARQYESGAKPKAVEYTFTSSKYDGNPIARRTLVYD